MWKKEKLISRGIARVFFALLLIPTFSCSLGVRSLSRAELTLKTFTGKSTPSYPVGVFNVNDSYLGFAPDQATFVALWNGDSSDQAAGTLSAGSTLVSFKLATIASTAAAPTSVRGLRYWQMDVDNNANIFCDDNSRILAEGVIHVGSASQAWNSVYVASYFGNYVNDDGFLNRTRTRYVQFPVSGTGVVVTVFHNEDDETMGWAGSDYAYIANSTNALLPTRMANIRGALPPYVKSFIFSFSSAGLAGDGIDFHNFTNWGELQNLEHIESWSNAYSVYHTIIPDMTKLYTLKGFGLGARDVGDGLDAYQMTRTNYPNLVKMDASFSTNAPMTNFLADIPDLQRGVDLGGSGLDSTADVDTFLVNLNTLLAGAPAPTGAVLRIQDGGPSASGSSSAAQTSLTAMGYSIQ